MVKKKGKYIKLIIFLVVVIVIVGAVVSNLNKKPVVVVNSLILSKGQLQNTINIKGIVKSVTTENVYATVGNQIKKVNVKVGDVVTEGQLLMELDTEELELNIAQQHALLSKQSQSNYNQLNNNERIYNEASNNLSSGGDSQLISATSRVKTTQNALENAQKNYDDKIKEQNNKESSQIINAESSLRNAEIDLENKQSDYDKSKILADSGVISKNDFEKNEQALESAKNKLEDAKKTLDTTKNSMSKELDQLQQALDTAKINYEDAKSTLSATNTTVKQSVQKYQDNLKSSQIAINNDSDLIAIKKLEKQLSKSKITSPISGTVTAVYAKQGATASGLMYVIEDTNDLMISTKIKEFDSTKISIGMPVTIKSDATGEEVYEGEITKIAPTSLKSNTGEIATSQEVEFETEVSVKTKDTKLKIGMNTRLSIVLEEKSDVFFVPYDAITYDKNDDTIIFIMEPFENTFVAKSLKVQKGMENDLYVEISGDEIKEGLNIINDASEITEGLVITLEKGDANE